MGWWTMTRLFSEPITVTLVESVADASGRPVETETSSVVKGAFAQRSMTDVLSDGVIATSEIAVYLPYNTLVRLGDRVQIRGETYEVVSVAFPRVNFRTGQMHHVELKVRGSAR
jgi:SPP1 family predicted phage head-tail adaptor